MFLVIKGFWLFWNDNGGLIRLRIWGGWVYVFGIIGFYNVWYVVYFMVCIIICLFNIFVFL